MWCRHEEVVGGCRFIVSGRPPRRMSEGSHLVITSYYNHYKILWSRLTAPKSTIFILVAVIFLSFTLSKEKRPRKISLGKFRTLVAHPMKFAVSHRGWSSLTLHIWFCRPLFLLLTFMGDFPFKYWQKFGSSSRISRRPLRSLQGPRGMGISTSWSFLFVGFVFLPGNTMKQRERQSN